MLLLLAWGRTVDGTFHVDGALPEAGLGIERNQLVKALETTY